DTSPATFGGGGIAFSPDDSRLLANAQVTILEADLDAAQPVLDTALFTFENYTWGISMGFMEYGPDDVLYIGNMSRSKYLHAIVFGDSSGANWQFEWRRLALPVQ